MVWERQRALPARARHQQQRPWVTMRATGPAQAEEVASARMMIWETAGQSRRHPLRLESFVTDPVRAGAILPRISAASECFWTGRQQLAKAARAWAPVEAAVQLAASAPS